MEWASFYGGVARGLATILGTPDDHSFDSASSQGVDVVAESFLGAGACGGLTREERQVEHAIMSQSQARSCRWEPPTAPLGDGTSNER